MLTMKKLALAVPALGLLAMMGLPVTPIYCYATEPLGGCEDLEACIEECEDLFDELVDWCLDHPDWSDPAFAEICGKNSIIALCNCMGQAYGEELSCTWPSDPN
jgi:hypothetical protein